MCRYATLLPSLGFIVGLIIWIATWRYAIDCMVQSADGYTDSPEVSLEDRVGNPRGILAGHVIAVLACVAIAAFAPAFLWLALAIAALLLPALDMSLSFDGDIVVALSPVTWIRIVARFGSTYLIPVIANAALALLIAAIRRA